MSFVLGIIGLCVILFAVGKEKVGSFAFESELDAQFRTEREFYAKYSSIGLEIMIRNQIENLTQKYSPDYDPQIRAAISNELQTAVRGTKYWSDLDVDSEWYRTMAPYILLANRGYIPRRYGGALGGLGNFGEGILQYIYTSERTRVTPEKIEKDIEFFELIENILHKQNVPYRWMLVTHSRPIRGEMLWGGLTVHPYEGWRERTLEDVKRDLQSARERRRQPLPPPYYEQQK